MADRGDMNYTKITHGWVEQDYDSTGTCIAQRFVPLDSADPERRIQREDDTAADHDELIEDPALLAQIETKERHQDMELVQP